MLPRLLLVGRRRKALEEFDLTDPDENATGNLVKIVVHQSSPTGKVLLEIDGEKACTSGRLEEYFELPGDEESELVVTRAKRQIRIPLKQLQDRKIRRGWHELGKDAWVEMTMRLVHDPKRTLDIGPWWPTTTSGSPPNALRVIVLRAKQLPIMDLRSSDPYVRLDVDGKQQKTSIKMRQLNPVWIETFDFHTYDDRPRVLEATVFDYDVVGSDDLIGTALVDLVPKHSSRKWHTLSLASKKSSSKKSKKDERKAARLELAFCFYHDPKLNLQLPPDTLDVVTSRHKPANELRVVVIRARNLPCMDTNLLTNAATSSDPFVRLELNGILRTSTVKRRCLEPIWQELLTFPLDDDDDMSGLKEMAVSVYDFDVFSSPDLIGSVNIPLGSFGGSDRKTMRAWHELTLAPGVVPEEASRKQTLKGPPPAPKIEVAFRIIHNPALVVEIPHEALDDKHGDQFGNELRVVVIRARALPAADSGKNMFGGGDKAAGSGDPFVILTYDDVEVKSTVKSKCLDPVWNETFALPATSPQEDVLEVGVWDRDIGGSKEAMGSVAIPTKILLDRNIHRAWYALSTAGKIEIALRLVHNPAKVVQLPDEIAITRHADKAANELRIFASCVRHIDSSAFKKGDKMLLDFTDDDNSNCRTLPKPFDVEQKFGDVLSIPMNPIGLTNSLGLRVRLMRRTKRSGGDIEFGVGEPLSMVALKDRAPVKRWVQLLDRNRKFAGKAEIAMRWVHNPNRHVELPKSVAHRSIDMKKPVNQVYVVLIHAREIGITDMVLATTRLGSAGKTSKPLSPDAVWMEDATFGITPKDLEDPDIKNRYVEVTIVTKDANELVGRCVLPLKGMLPAGEGKRAWHKLCNALMPGSSVEVYAVVAHSVQHALHERERHLRRIERLEIQAADTCALQPMALVEESVAAVDAYARRLAMLDKAYNHPPRANELDVVVVRGVGLAAGSRKEPAQVIKCIPDSYVRADLIGSFVDGHKRRIRLSSHTTRTIRQERLPTWLEKLTIGIPDTAKPEACALKLSVHDAASIEENKAIGSILVELSDVVVEQERNKSSRAWRKWCNLSDQAGRIDVWARLSYNPERMAEVALSDEIEAFPEEPINELRVVLVTARLKAGVARSTGLRATLEYAGRTRTLRAVSWLDTAAESQTFHSNSSTKQQVFWRDRFDFIINDGKVRLDSLVIAVTYEDMEPVGWCKVPILERSDVVDKRSARRGWHNLTCEGSDEVLAEIEVVTRLTHNPNLEKMLPVPTKAIDEASCTAVDAPKPPCDEASETYLAHIIDDDRAPSRWFFVPTNEAGPDGPYNVTGLRRLWGDGVIENDTLVWRQGMTEWVPIDKLAALKRILWDYPDLPMEATTYDTEEQRDWFYAERSPRYQETQAAPAAATSSDECVVVDLIEELDSKALSPFNETVEMEAAGPFSEGELRDAVETGRLSKKSLVWHADENKWNSCEEAIPTWKTRSECTARPILEPSAGSSVCELCGGFATLHSVDALSLQLREGDCLDFLEKPLRGSKIVKSASTLTLSSAIEIVDGLVWVGADDANELVNATHIVELVESQQETPLPSFNQPALSQRYASRHGDYDGKSIDRRVGSLFARHLEPVKEAELTAETCQALKASVGGVPKFPETIQVEMRDETCLSRAQDSVWNFIENVVHKRWERPEKRPARILIRDTEHPPVRAIAIAGAYAARCEGLTGDEILAVLPQLPSRWQEALVGTADANAIGRLFCNECFDEWRNSNTDNDTASTKQLVGANGESGIEDPARRFLDLKDEGLLDNHLDVADILGVRAKYLTALDASGCGLDDDGCTRLVEGLQVNGGGSQLVTLRVNYNMIQDKAAESLASLFSVTSAKEGGDSGDTIPSLTWLEASHNSITSRGARYVALALRRSETLTSLDISHNRIGDVGGAEVCSAMIIPDTETLISVRAFEYKHRVLREEGLAISDNDEAATIAIKYFNTTLTRLNVASNDLGPTALDALARAVSTNRVLFDIDIATNPRLFHDMNVASQVAKSHRLRRNSVEHVEDDVLDKVVHVDLFAALYDSRNCCLSRLSLANVPLHSDVLREIALWLGSISCACRSLDLSTTCMLPERCAAFADALVAKDAMNAPLETLELSGNSFGTYGLTRMVAALAVCLCVGKKRAPTKLGLAQCALSSAGGSALFALLDGRLDAILSAIDAGKDGKEMAVSRLKRVAANIDDYSVFWHVTGLDLSDNDLGPTAAEELASALKYRADVHPIPNSIESLNLSNTHLSIKGAEVLATVLTREIFPLLQSLDLSANGIRDTGCVAIAKALPNHPGLSYVSLARNDVTGLGTASVQQALSETTGNQHPLVVDLQGNEDHQTEKKKGV